MLLHQKPSINAQVDLVSEPALGDLRLKIGRAGEPGVPVILPAADTA